MASSTPPLTASSKPFRSQHYPHHNLSNRHSQSGRHGHSWSSQKFFLNKSTASCNAARAGNSNARPLPRIPNLVSFSSFSSSKSELGADFCGRRSTRLVSKMHFGRPKAVSSSRHTSIAEEVLQYITSFRVGDYVAIERVLVSFESQLCGSDDYTFLLRELGNRGECSKAMWCFEFAVRRERRRNEQGKLASAMISVLGRLGKVELARKVFDAAAEEGYGNTVYAFSALISAYGRSGCCEEAIRVFDSMRGIGLKPNLVTYNAVIDACGKGGIEFDKAVEIFDEMVRYGVQPDRITFNSLLAVCSRGGLWKAAKDLFNEMISRGIDQDVFTYNTLLDAICKGGQMDLAFEIMSDMTQKNILPNVVTYSTMIDGYAKCGRFDDALNMFDEMRLAGIKLDRVSYNTLLSLYAKLGLFHEVVNVCKEMECCGIRKDIVTYNALLGGYGKQGKYDEVKRVFDEMKAERISPNLLSYSTLVDVYAKGCLYKEAMEVFKEFKRAGLRADVVFYSALIDAFCKNGMVECCVYLLNKMTQEGIMPNVVTYNSIIDAFGRSASDEACKSQVEPSSSLFSVVDHDAGVYRDDSVARLFGQLALEKAYNGGKDKNCRKDILCILDVFRKMHKMDIRPNVVTFSAILNACSRCNSFEDASMLLEELRLFDNRVYGVAHGLLVGNGKSTWAEAQSVFDEVKKMDSPTASAFYNALTDMLWHFGQKRGAQLVVLEGKRRNVWENMWSDSCLDLHLMSSGAARAMVHSWLLSIHSIVYDGRELPNLLSILTGWGKHSKIVGDGALRRAIEALLTGMGAPFRVAKCNLGRFISSGAVVAAWLKEVRTLQLLVLNDNRTFPGNGSVGQISSMQALALQ